MLFYRFHHYVAYRQFTCWMHNHLGRNLRRAAPSCVVNAIKTEFPAPDRIYVRFKEAEEQKNETYLNAHIKT